MYTLSETARLAEGSSATVRRWMYGYTSPTGNMLPVSGTENRMKEQGAAVSFLQLADIVVVGRFRRKKVILERLRRANSFAREHFGLGSPFASLRLRTDGVHELHHIGEDYLPCYLSEFDFRWNHRKISDAERFAALMAQTQGRLLWYCRTPQPENPHA